MVDHVLYFYFYLRSPGTLSIPTYPAIYVLEGEEWDVCGVLMDACSSIWECLSTLRSMPDELYDESSIRVNILVYVEDSYNL